MSIHFSLILSWQSSCQIEVYFRLTAAMAQMTSPLLDIFKPWFHLLKGQSNPSIAHQYTRRLAIPNDANEVQGFGLLAVWPLNMDENVLRQRKFRNCWFLGKAEVMEPTSSTPAVLDSLTVSKINKQQTKRKTKKTAIETRLPAVRMIQYLVSATLKASRSQ